MITELSSLTEKTEFVVGVSSLYGVGKLGDNASARTIGNGKIISYDGDIMM